MTNLDSAYNVNAAIQAEKVAERLYYPDRLARLREIEDNDIEPGRFWTPESELEARAPVVWEYPCFLCDKNTEQVGSGLCNSCRTQYIDRLVSPYPNNREEMIEIIRKERANANA